MIRVAINGFGRIGRLAFREIITGTDFDIIAINDLTDAEELAYLLKYDTNHRTFHEDLISHDKDELVINNKKRIKVYAEKDPSNLPWKELEINLVIECTGFFTDEEGGMKHINAGAKKVLISAPAKGNIKTIVYNVNDNIIDGSEEIVSGSSCTTNCLAPVVKIIHENFGIEKGFMTTVHAYTNDQAILDIAHSKGISARRGRAGAANIIPSSTGAASSIGEVIPELKGKLDGSSYRVPVPDGSIVDCVLEIKKNTTIDEVNNLFTNNQNETIKITMDPIVSSDVLGRKIGALVDGNLTTLIETEGRQLLKISAWYDNEIGYTAQLIRTAKKLFNV